MSYISLLNENQFTGVVNASSLTINGQLDLRNASAILGLVDNVTVELITNPLNNKPKNLIQIKNNGVTNDKIVSMDSNKLTGNISVSGGNVKLLLTINMDANDIINTGDIIPYDDEVQHIGSIINKFANIYSRDGYFTGSINSPIIDNSLGVKIMYNGSLCLETGLNILNILVNTLLSGNLSCSGNIYPLLDGFSTLGINTNRYLTLYTKNIESSDGFNLKYGNSIKLSVLNNGVTIAGTTTTDNLTVGTLTGYIKGTSGVISSSSTIPQVDVVNLVTDLTTLFNRTQYQSATGNVTTFNSDIRPNADFSRNIGSSTLRYITTYSRYVDDPNGAVLRYAGSSKVTAQSTGAQITGVLNVQFIDYGLNTITIRTQGVDRLTLTNTLATFTTPLTTGANAFTCGGATIGALTGYIKGLIGVISASATIPQTDIDNLVTDLATKLNLSGGTMTGSINMGTNNIININNISTTTLTLNGTDLNTRLTSDESNITTLLNRTQYQSASANNTTFTGQITSTTSINTPILTLTGAIRNYEIIQTTGDLYIQKVGGGGLKIRGSDGLGTWTQYGFQTPILFCTQYNGFNTGTALSFNFGGVERLNIGSSVTVSNAVLNVATINNATGINLQYNGTNRILIQSGGVRIDHGIATGDFVQIGNNLVKRKALVLYNAANNDHQWYGFGIQAGEMVYQTEARTTNHNFYCGSSSTTSDLLFSIEYDNGVIAYRPLNMNANNITNTNNISTTTLTLNGVDLDGRLDFDETYINTLLTKTQYQTVPSLNNTSFSGTLNTDTINNTNTIITTAINNNLGFTLQYGGNNKVLITSTGASINGILLAPVINGATSVSLQYASSTKLLTTNTGVTVTGILTSDNIVVTGGQKVSVTSVSGNLSLNGSTHYILAVNTSATRTLTLPLANTAGIGTIFIIKDVTGQASKYPIIIARSGSDTIDGQTSFGIKYNRASISIVATNTTEWSII